MEKQLVSQWMTPEPITITSETTLPEAHRLMKERDIRRLPPKQPRSTLLNCIPCRTNCLSASS